MCDLSIAAIPKTDQFKIFLRKIRWQLPKILYSRRKALNKAFTKKKKKRNLAGDLICASKSSFYYFQEGKKYLAWLAKASFLFKICLLSMSPLMFTEIYVS